MIWYPYEQMKTMKPPYMIKDAEGVYLYTCLLYTSDAADEL